MARRTEKALTELRAPHVDIVVLGARAEEREALSLELEKFSDAEQTFSLRNRVDGLVYSIQVAPKLSGNLTDYASVSVMECAEMGNVASAINTAYAVLRYEPSLIIFSGIAGSLDSEKFRIGDVILPRIIRTRYFQKLKTFEKEYASIPDIEKTELLEHVNGSLITATDSVSISQPSRDLLLKVNARNLSEELENIDIPNDWISKYNIPNRKPRLINEEEAFSWNKVLSNKKYTEHLKKNITSAWTTVDMESYGFLRSVDKLRGLKDYKPYSTSGMVVRAVSDFAQYKHLSDSHPQWRDLGLRNMAIATRFVIQKYFHGTF